MGDQVVNRKRATRLGEIAVELGFVPTAELLRCISYQEKARESGFELPLGELLVLEGFLDFDKLHEILQIQERRNRARGATPRPGRPPAPVAPGPTGGSDPEAAAPVAQEGAAAEAGASEEDEEPPHPNFGEVALSLGLLTSEQLDAALEEQARWEWASGERPPLGEILVTRGHLSAEQVFKIISGQGEMWLVCPTCRKRFYLGAAPSIAGSIPCVACGSMLQVVTAHGPGEEDADEADEGGPLDDALRDPSADDEEEADMTWLEEMVPPAAAQGPELLNEAPLAPVAPVRPADPASGRFRRILDTNKATLDTPLVESCPSDLWAAPGDVRIAASDPASQPALRDWVPAPPKTPPPAPELPAAQAEEAVPQAENETESEPEPEQSEPISEERADEPQPPERVPSAEEPVAPDPATRLPAVRRRAKSGPRPVAPPALASDFTPGPGSHPGTGGTPWPTPTAAIRKKATPSFLSNRRWLLQEAVAEQGPYQVFRVFDQLLQRELACKTLHEDCRMEFEEGERLVREALIMARIPHPAIPGIHEVGWTTDGRRYAITDPFHTDPTMAQILIGLRSANPRMASRWSLERILAVFMTVASGLGAAHQGGDLHGALRLQQVRLGPHNRVAITGWTGVRVESLEGRPRAVRQDIFGLGRILGEILASMPRSIAPTVALHRIREGLEEVEAGALGRGRAPYPSVEELLRDVELAIF